MDAQQFDIPDDSTLIYLWNPFVGEVLANAAEPIEKHIPAPQRLVNLIVALPEGETESLNKFSRSEFKQTIAPPFQTVTEIYWFINPLASS